jgi:hypothetical protein
MQEELVKLENDFAERSPTMTETRSMESSPTTGSSLTPMEA